MSFRDVREHRKLDLQHKLEAFDWNLIDSCANLDEATNLLSDSLKRMHDGSCPLIKIKVSSRDPPYMTPLIKHLCRKRNKNFKNGHKNDLQERLNNLIRKNQTRSIRQENRKYETGSKKWWDNVHKITGRKRGSQNVSSILSPSAINQYFKEINTDPAYSIPHRIPIPPGTRVPALEVHTIQRFLARQKRTAPGPDGLPHWIWRDFSHLLAPVITKLFNRSLQEQFVPCPWKLANVTPIPIKESPFTNCNQLRPISLTNIIIRLFEKLILKFELFHILKLLIRPDQFAYKENSNTTMALVKSQHYWLKWLDGNANFVRVLSFDFSKAFDTVSHYILSDKPKATDINPYVINWILDFLSQRKQRVVVDGITTEFIDINRGVPQGTVLGPILFSLMVNDIQLADPRRNLLVKFADDITISIPVSNDSTDATINEVNSIRDWAASNRMTLNLSKTWEMLIHGKTTKPNPQPVPDIERKSWLKLLGITFQENPCCWDLHVDKLIAKASSRLYILRVCKFYGYSQEVI